MAASLNPYITACGEEFDAGKSSQYRLTIQFALGGLSYALLDTDANRLITLEYYQSDLLSDSNDLFHTLERALESKGLNNKAFASVTCIVDERINTLVPEALYQPEEPEKYLSFGFNLPSGYMMLADRLACKAVNLYALPQTLRNKVLAKWPEAKLTHSSSVFINSLPYTERSTVFVNVRNRDFDMAVTNEGQLTFFNNFRFNTKDDFVYFLVFAMEQNGLSGQDTPVCFTGLIRPASEIIDLCGRYVSDLRFVEDPNVFSVSEALAEVPFQYYYTHYQSLR